MKEILIEESDSEQSTRLDQLIQSITDHLRKENIIEMIGLFLFSQIVWPNDSFHFIR